METTVGEIFIAEMGNIKINLIRAEYRDHGAYSSIYFNLKTNQFTHTVLQFEEKWRTVHSAKF